MNENLFAPVNGEGDNGRPVVIPPREILKMQQLFQINRFNLLASDRIPLNRTLPDVRKKKYFFFVVDQSMPIRFDLILFFFFFSLDV